MRCTVFQIGRIDYIEAYNLQTELLRQRIDKNIDDTLLLVEHPSTITVGKSGKIDNILAPGDVLAGQQIPVYCMDRGGDVTYHGPGQIVGYPIIDLNNRNNDLRQYVRDLEEVLNRTLDDFGITASRDTDHPGIWIDNEEIVAIGLRVRRWVTMHGFALNVNTDLDPFSLINPCGFSDRKATSMAQRLSRDVSISDVTDSILTHFADVFDAQLEWGSVDELRSSSNACKIAGLV